MILSGFTFIRNGIRLGYPFIECVRTLEAICDEVIVVVGDGDDGTLELLEQHARQSPKLRIVQSVWDMSRRDGGKVFADQANLGLDACQGRWLLHLQADELLHETDFSKVKAAIADYDGDARTEGFILPFLHFWGSYKYVRNTRRMHRHEVKLLRNLPGLRSYGDSQGFRIYPSPEAYAQDHPGRKLNVRLLNAPVYHYGHVKNNRQAQLEKLAAFDRMHSNQANQKAADYQAFNYNAVDRLAPFAGEHPSLLKPSIEAASDDFVYDPSKAVWSKKDRWIQPLEDWLGFKFGEYKNYRLIQ